MQKVLETKSDERRNIFGRKSRFTYEEVLQQGIQLADALNYLHSKVVVSEACIIHRGTMCIVAIYVLHFFLSYFS